MGRIAWIVSYPKSGNTWVRLMLSSLADGGREIDINAPILKSAVATYEDFEEAFGVESGDLTADEIEICRPALHAAIAEDSDRPVALRKVHDRYSFASTGEPVFPASVTCGAVYLVRDPRDVAASYSHHRGEDLDAIIRFMADEQAVLAEPGERFKPQLPQPLGSWSTHVSSWLDQKEIRVTLVRYEDLIENPCVIFGKIAQELGFSSDRALIKSVVDATRFEKLKAQEQAAGFRERRIGSTAPFFREGRAGNWRALLSREQAGEIEAMHREMMERLGYLRSSGR